MNVNEISEKILGTDVRLDLHVEDKVFIDLKTKEPGELPTIYRNNVFINSARPLRPLRPLR
jgi:hypothetical protein